MQPLISVIVPIYKVEKYLHQCVDSILNQTYKNLEVILVDDGSPDGCPAICDEYAEKDSRIHVIHQENGGQSDARNAGLRQAAGEYIMFVDSDDWLDQELVNKVMVLSPFSIAIFGCTMTDYTGCPQEVISAAEQNRGILITKDTKLLEKLLRNSLLGYAWNKIYNRAAIDRTHFPCLSDREDLVFNLQVLSRVSQVVLSEQNGYYYRQHSSSSLHASFHAPVPDYMRTAEVLMDAFTMLPVDNRQVLCNTAVKTYLTDAVYRYIKCNSYLSATSRKAEIKKLFNHDRIRRGLSLRHNTCMLHRVFIFCFKFGLSSLFYEYYLVK